MPSACRRLAHLQHPSLFFAFPTNAQQRLRGHGISTTLVKIKGGREEAVAEAAEAFLLPFRVSPNCTPEELTVGSAEGSAAAAVVSEDVQPLLPEPWQQASAADGEMKGAYGGVVEATGARLLSGGWRGVRWRAAGLVRWEAGSALEGGWACQVGGGECAGGWLPS